MRNIIKNLIYIYFVLLFFSGIFTKILSTKQELWEIKSLLPDLILIFIIVLSLIEIILKKIKISKNNILYLISIYTTCVVILNLFTGAQLNNILLVSRDVYLPFIAGFLLLNLNYSTKEKKTIIKGILIICIIQIISGFILGVLEYKNGSEWTSRFYTGYSFYGLDEKSNIKVWHSSGNLRVPSIAGNSVLFAFYNLISFFWIKKYYEHMFKYIFLIIAVMNILLSTNKTTLVILILIYLLYLINRLNKYLKISFIINCILLILVASFFIYKFNPSIYFSLSERFKIWKELFENIEVVSVIIPIKLFKVGAGSSGYISVVDNSYMYILFSYGIIGIIIYIHLLINLYNIYLKTNNIIMLFFVTSLVYGGITLNIFQGRVFVTPMLLLLFLFKNKIELQEGDKYEDIIN